MSDSEEYEDVSLCNDIDSGSEDETPEIQYDEIKEGAYLAMEHESNVFLGRNIKRKFCEYHL